MWRVRSRRQNPPFGLSPSKPLHFVLEGERFDRLTANGRGRDLRENGANGEFASANGFTLVEVLVALVVTSMLLVVVMAPADMPAALYVKGVDAYCTGEPFGAAAQSAGYARVLSMTRDEWPRYMCCVLTVREELIARNRPLVQNMVDYVLAAGRWLDARPENRDRAVEIAARRQYFNQDPAILQFVMDNPEDRVTYGDLRMIPREFDEMMELAVEAGTLSHPVPYETYVDESFARAARPASIAL